MIHRSLLLAVIAIFGLQTGVYAKGEKSAAVNCTLPGASVQAAVDNVTPGVPTTIFITGQCLGDVTIRSDAITLSGDQMGLGLRGGQGTIDGEIKVIGANNVAIMNLTVTGSGAGVTVRDSANVNIRDSVLDGNEFEGVQVINAAFAEISGTDITDNSQFSFGRGLIVQRNSAAVLSCNNVITGNGADNGSAVYLEEGGALRQQHCASGELDIIEARTDVTGGDAIFIFNGSIVDIRGADVSGATVIHGGGTFRAQTSNLNGNVDASAGSLVGFRPNTIFVGTLSCDASSQVFGSLRGLGAVQCGQTCTGNTGTCAGGS